MPTDIAISVEFSGRQLGIPRFPRKTMNVDIAGTDHCNVTQDIPTTAAGTLVLIPASMSTLGVGYLINRADPVSAPTQYIDVGRQVAGTFYPVFRIYPGEEWPVRFGLATNALYAKANAATTKLQLCAAEE